MKEEINKFLCITQTEYTETRNLFTAINKKANYRKRYVLNVKSVRYEYGIKKSDNTANIYFDTYDELKVKMEYHYNLCKDNLFTTQIEIIK